MFPGINRRAWNWFKRTRGPNTFWSRPRLLDLEDRVTPANATLSSGTLTIDYTAIGVTSETVTATNDGTNITLTGNITGSTSNPVGSVSKIVVTDSGLSNNQSLTITGTATYTLSGGFSSTDVETVVISRTVNVTGSSTISIVAPKTISITSGLSTVNGNITLSANQQMTPTTGNFAGVDVNGGAALISGTGVLTVNGRGGDTGSNQYGVQVRGAGVLQGGTIGTSTIISGTGGASTGSLNVGVAVLNTNSKITSAGGDVQVTGQGAGTGAGTSGYGVQCSGGSSITAGGMGSVSVTGTGGPSTGGANHGVLVILTGATITSSGGKVTVNGTGGGSGTAGSNVGVQVSAAGVITAGGSGAVEIIGQGGLNVSGINNYGVAITGFNSQMTSNGGNVTITGTGGGTGASDGGVGVYATSFGVMSAGGTGNLTILGTGGSTVGSSNYGARVTNDAKWSAGGNVLVTGIEGNNSSLGIVLLSSSSVSCGAVGTITLIADITSIDGSSTINAGTNTATLRQRTNGRAINVGGADVGGTNLGLTDAELDRVTAGTVQIGDSNSGAITISSTITHSSNLSLTTGAGVTVNNSISITMTTDKSLTVSAVGTMALDLAAKFSSSGTGSIGLTTERDITMANGSSLFSVNGAISVSANQQLTPTSGNFAGIEMDGATIVVNNAAGILTMKGRGGDDAGGAQYGVYLHNGSTASGGKSPGTTTIEGTGGASPGNNNHGVFLTNASSSISTFGSNLVVTGQGGGVGSSSANYGVGLTSGGSLSTGGTTATNTVTGNGGNTSGGSNHGVYVDGNSGITSTNGTTVIGTGFGTGPMNIGVVSSNGSNISCGSATASIDVTGKGSTTSTGNNNYGVYVFSADITSNGGPVHVTGTGGGSGAAASCFGIFTDTNARIDSNLFELVLIGQGGSGSGADNHGAVLSNNSDWEATTNVTITGIEGSGSSPLGLSTGGSDIVSSNSDITLIADTMSAFAQMFANTITLKPRTAGWAIDMGGNDVVGGKLGILLNEIFQMNADLFQIGDANSGPITTSAIITFPSAHTFSLTTGQSITFGANFNTVGGNLTLNSAGAITQTSGTVQTGAGTLTLQAASGQTATFITAGNKAASLIVPAKVTAIINGSFDTTGFVQVDGTLSGTNGTVGTTTVSSTGKVAPGTSPGKLNTGNIAFNAASVLTIELNGTVAGTSYDQLAVAGTVNLGGASLTGSVGFTLTVGQVFTIVDNNGSGDAVTGTFNGIVEGGTTTLGAFNFKVSYKGGDGNDVTLTRLASPTATVTFGDGTNQRSMVKQVVVTFSESVNFSGPVANAFTLFRSGSGAPTGNVTLTTNPVSGPASSVTITFSGSMTTNDSLNDGFYDFTIDADQVMGAGGKLDGGAGAGSDYTVVGNTTNQYFRLFGDANGDGTTNLGDFAAFRSVFNLGAHAAFDYGEGDNNVGLADFAQFRGRFNLTP